MTVQITRLQRYQKDDTHITVAEAWGRTFSIYYKDEWVVTPVDPAQLEADGYTLTENYDSPHTQVSNFAGFMAGIVSTHA